MYKINFKEPIHIHFIGIGGISMSGLAEILLKEDFTISGSDNKESALTDHLEQMGAKVFYGQKASNIIDGIDVVVYTAAIHKDNEEYQAAVQKGLPMLTRAELLGQLMTNYDIPIAVSGTHGKTTTTSLVGEIMANYFADVKVVGNIGIPYTSVAADTTDDTVTVAEISSFQLETTHEFAPQVTAILNITPDHLNRHHTIECYIETKESITKNQTADDTCVLNYEDEVLRRFGETLHTKVVYFSSRRKLEKGLYLAGEDIFYADGTADTKVINVNELNILGKHNYENVMAAVGMAVSFGVPMEKIVEVLKRFQAVEHRIEYVTEKRGVKFYNDSKGTNPDAAIQGIRAMNRPTLLIGGGYDKQSEYDEWIESFDGKVKKLVLIGQTKEKIAECAKKHGFTDVILCDTFEEAIDTCYANAVSGDAVLLSPACASWGMFANYEERGRIFKEYVRNLAE